MTMVSVPMIENCTDRYLIVGGINQRPKNEDDKEELTINLPNEVIDIDNPEVTCSTLEEPAQKVHQLTGGLLGVKGGSPFICGGSSHAVDVFGDKDTTSGDFSGKNVRVQFTNLWPVLMDFSFQNYFRECYIIDGNDNSLTRQLLIHDSLESSSIVIGPKSDILFITGGFEGEE